MAGASTAKLSPGRFTLKLILNSICSFQINTKNAILTKLFFRKIWIMAIMADDMLLQGRRRKFTVVRDRSGRVAVGRRPLVPVKTRRVA